MKRTLERELKVPEIARREAYETSPACEIVVPERELSVVSASVGGFCER